MKTLLTILASLFFCISSVYAEEEKKKIPPDENWEETIVGFYLGTASIFKVLKQ